MSYFEEIADRFNEELSHVLRENREGDILDEDMIIDEDYDGPVRRRKSRVISIHPWQIPDIISRIHLGHGGQDTSDPYPFNCYPGNPTKACFPEAFFVSLSSKALIGKTRNHMSLSSLFSKLIKHMQGYCPGGQTKKVIVLTDSWDPNVYSSWAENLEQIKQYAHIEGYLLLPGRRVVPLHL